MLKNMDIGMIFFTKDDELKQKYDWFMIVRNPYDRILSEYYCG